MNFFSILVVTLCAGVGRLRSGSESEQRVSMRVHRSGTSNIQTPELSRATDRCVETWANRLVGPVSLLYYCCSKDTTHDFFPLKYL